MGSRLALLLPARLAAPETVQLRCMRYRTIAAALALAATACLFGAVADLLRRFAAPALLALAVYCVIQAIVWLRAKRAADDVYLEAECARND